MNLEEAAEHLIKQGLRILPVFNKRPALDQTGDYPHRAMTLEEFTAACRAHSVNGIAVYSTETNVTLDIEGAGMEPYADIIESLVNTYHDAVVKTPNGVHFYFHITDGIDDNIPGRLAGLDETLWVEVRKAPQYAVAAGPGRKWSDNFAPAQIDLRTFKAHLLAIRLATVQAGGDLFDVATAPARPSTGTTHISNDTGAAVIEALRAGSISPLQLLPTGWKITGINNRTGRTYILRPGSSARDSGNTLDGVTHIHSTSIPWHGKSLSAVELFQHAFEHSSYFDAVSVIEAAAVNWGENKVRPSEWPLNSWPDELLDEIYALNKYRPKAGVVDIAKLRAPAGLFERPELQHVEKSALAVGASPMAVLGIVLARVASAIPPSVVLPSIKSRKGSLNFFVGIAGEPSSGKGTSIDCGKECVDIEGAPEHPVGIGSGQGILHQYNTRMSTKQQTAKLKELNAELATATGAEKSKLAQLLGMDEAGPITQLTNEQSLIHLADSVIFEAMEITSLDGFQGSATTQIIPQLAKAFFGEDLSYGYVDTTKNIPLKPHSYRLVFWAGIQPDKSDILYGHKGMGLPQRFLMLTAFNPDASEEETETPAPLSYTLPPLGEPDSTGFHHLEVCEEARQTTRELRAAGNRGELRSDEMAGHRNFIRLKVAALLGAFNGHWGVNEEDWRLAGLVVNEHHIAVERYLEEHKKQDVLGGAIAAGVRDAIKQDAMINALEDLAAEKVAKYSQKIAENVWLCNDTKHKDGGCPKSSDCVKNAIRADVRRTYKTILEESIKLAIMNTWIEEKVSEHRSREVRKYIPGKTKP